MRAKNVQAALIGAMIIVIIMFGFEVISNPSAHNEPTSAQPESSQQDAPIVYQSRTVAQAQRGLNGTEDPLTYMALQDEKMTGTTYARPEATVEKIASGTGEALQSMSSGGIRLVVDLFASMTD